MKYIRPKSDLKLSPEDKRELLIEYFDYYRNVSKSAPQLLNSKLPRSAFDELLNDIGVLILNKASDVLEAKNEITDFLDENALPEHLEGYLPKEFRVYCLALNAVKQWLSAEQAATDRYIFGGTVRSQCKALGDSCLVSGIPAVNCTIELHHPVRDGRPPIPVAKEEHAKIEGQASGTNEKDKVMEIVYPIKRSGNRSWVMLKLGCELLLGVSSSKKSKNVQSSSKTFARKAKDATGLDYQELLIWIEKNELA